MRLKLEAEEGKMLFTDVAKAARAGGEVAGKARKDLESKINRSVVSSTNFKEIPE